jgi:hypothetical protein
MVMKRLLPMIALLLAAACGGGGGSDPDGAAPDFELMDLNTGSATAGQNVSPRDYQGDTSAWFFADANSAQSQDQFGLLDRIQDEMWIEGRTFAATMAIQILAVNKIGAEAGSAGMVAGTDLPCVQDTAAAGVQTMWTASDGDVVVLDEDNVPVATYNVLANDLNVAANRDELKELLRGGPAQPVPDFLVKDMNPASPTADEDVSPRDYLGKVSGYYFGAAT